MIFFFVQEWRSVLREPMNAWTWEAKGDCALVLTGGSGRIREGLGLISRRAVRKLIISGVHSEAHLRDIVPSLPFYGVNDISDIVLEKRSSTTYGNAQQAWPLIEALKCQDLVLVTSQMHMSRAFRTLMAAQTTLIPVHKLALPTPPSESTSVDLLTEVLKSFFYSLWAY